MNYDFRKATTSDIPKIWKIIQQAIARRKNDGSQQWQDGYPNEDVIRTDITKGIGYVLTDNETITSYAAILFNDEPAYEQLKGTWLTNGDFAVVHRVAISDNYTGKGLAQKIFLFTEDLVIKKNIFSIKVDTNFDNIPMLKILEKLGYTYCGEVNFRGSDRKAFEKKLPVF
ncbi:GNAT family N-acetyltransferase [Flavobacterium paronense]|uniref:GNAT family N-acetyltransferase n=1 Tax=Flavobacterium paronense TaxID=1392775 RepID=A0ABV5GC92_9FLAO|nr:GNAT family N-acetyltransferase [Flavobacterium paronense]MDN3677854.1 GNAT family N-acetyltransferase [Flavobacterium paronense]